MTTFLNLLLTSLFTLVFARTQPNLQGKILKAHREISLTENDLIIFVNQVIFIPDPLDQGVFYHAIAKEFEDSLVYIKFQTDRLELDFDKHATKLSKNDPVLQTKLGDRPDMVFYKYDLSRLLQQKSSLEKLEDMPDNSMRIIVTEWYKRRYTPYPKEAAYLEKHSFELEESAYFLTPYPVDWQITRFNMNPEENYVRSYTVYQPAGQGKNKGDKEYKEFIEYGPYKRLKAYSFERISVFVQTVEAKIAFQEVVRDIKVSHYGNINVHETFVAENLGPRIQGEFYHNYVNYRHKHVCQEGFESSYPWYIRDMYFTDMIGNLTTSRASRKDEQVQVMMKPRFPICSGWTANWEQGYNMPIKYHLKQNVQNQNEFIFELPVMFPIYVISADNFTIQVTLPSGAYDVKVDFPFSFGVNIDTNYWDRYFGTLDLIGRPVVKIQMPNANSYLHSKENFKVTYKVDAFYSILLKPVQLVGVIFAFLVCFIASFRFKLAIDSGEKKKLQIKSD